MTRSCYRSANRSIVETGYLALKPLLRATLSVSWERCRQMQFSATSRP